jgi:hypothetical protein
MNITRKEFCAGVAGGSVLLLLQACGGGGGGYSSGPGYGNGCGASGTNIVPSHGHTLAVPATDLDSTLPVTYPIMGTAGHDHTVTLNPAQLQALKAGTKVMVTSSTDDGGATGGIHFHTVSALCS